MTHSSLATADSAAEDLKVERKEDLAIKEGLEVAAADFKGSFSQRKALVSKAQTNLTY
jgi:hypothetical protein